MKPHRRQYNDDPKVHCWGGGEHPDWEFIKDAIWFHGFHCNMVPIETNSDDLCVVIGPKEMTEQQAKEEYDRQNGIW